MSFILFPCCFWWGIDSKCEGNLQETLPINSLLIIIWPLLLARHFLTLCKAVIAVHKTDSLWWRSECKGYNNIISINRCFEVCDITCFSMWCVPMCWWSCCAKATSQAPPPQTDIRHASLPTDTCSMHIGKETIQGWSGNTAKMFWQTCCWVWVHLLTIRSELETIFASCRQKVSVGPQRSKL